jgi:hypothetical protein
MFVAQFAVLFAQRVQNFAARIITNSRKFDHVTSLLNELHWLPVKLHLFYRNAVLTFKCKNGTAPDYLSNIILVNSLDSDWLKTVPIKH